MKKQSVAIVVLVSLVISLISVSAVGLHKPVGKVKNAIRVNHNKCVVLIDSYGDTQCSEVDLLPILKEQGANITQFVCQPGAGFYTNKGNHSFTEHMKNDFKYDPTVRQVWLIGGFNDIYNGNIEYDVKYNAGDFCQAAHEKFPNAEVKLCFVGHSPSSVSPDTWVVDNIYQNRYNLVKRTYYTMSNEFSYVTYVNGADKILNDSDFREDNIHPNAKGSQKLGISIATAMRYDLDYVEPEICGDVVELN